MKLRPADVLLALALLTVLPLPAADPRREEPGRATPYFPVIGLCIGAFLLGLNRLIARPLSPWASAVVLVVAWEAISAGEPLWAWRAVGNWREETPRPDAAGLIVMVLMVLGKVAGLAVQGGGRTTALLFAPLLARWAMVVLAAGARAAGASERKFNAAITFREFALASLLSFAVVLVLSEAFGVALLVGTAAFVVGSRLLVHRWSGGISWRFLQASAEAVETVVVVFCAICLTSGWGR